MTKVVIVHPGLYNGSNDALINSFASDVIPVRYKDDMTKDELLAAIGEETVTHLAFLYHYPGFPGLPFFYDLPSSDKQGGSNDQIIPKYVYFSDNVIDIIQTIKQDNDLILDILTCDLKDQKYKDEVAKIQTDLGINIRYSVDKTGNPSSGANWILESETPSVNVQPTYFTEGVLQWTNVLSADITSAIKAGTYSSYITWTAATSTYTLQQNFSWSVLGLSDADSYITLGTNEIFDGNGKTIDITGYNSWYGLFSTGGSSLSNASIVRNLGILNGYLGSYGGYLIRNQQFYFKVINCYSTGQISGGFGGGIAGGYAGYGAGGNCTITNCYTTGSITVDYAGGIAGGYAGSNSGLCTITNCYTTGDITVNGIQAGGIVGGYAGNTLGNCTITNCYTTGAIGGILAGGIDGAFSGSTITNCYTTGTIPQNTFGGGISGGSSNSNITNCVSNTPTGGAGSTGVITNCSTNLTVINNSIYGWDTTIWASGSEVTTVNNYKLPILRAFQSSPWIYNVTDPNYYDMAKDLALFYIPIELSLPVQPPVGEANLDTSNPQITLYTDSEDKSRVDDQTIRNFYDNQIRTLTTGLTSTSKPMFYSYDVLMKFKQGALKYRR